VNRGAVLLLPVPFVVYAWVMLVLGDLRWDHVALALLVAGLALRGGRARAFCVGAYPIALTAILYGSMRYFEGLGVTKERLHICDLYELERRLFGVDVSGGRITLSDYLLTHRSTALDVYCAIPYGTFLMACVLCALVLFLRDPAAMQRFTWGFLLLNIAGFITYHAYPAAPPWYLHAYGCKVDLLARARPGPGLDHVDALLHIGFFRGMYGRASDVFGAVPSLHVAYPLLILLEGWRHFHTVGRVAALWFLPSMCFAAVYLGHHWVIDITLGLLYAALTSALIHGIAAARRQVPMIASACLETMRPRR
jgi:inositol phosphorylceramide synthase catalytic subunit